MLLVPRKAAYSEGFRVPESSASLNGLSFQEKDHIETYSPCCDFTYVVDSDDQWLRPISELPASYGKESSIPLPSVAHTIEKAVDSLNAKLRELSCKIHGEIQTPVATTASEDPL